MTHPKKIEDIKSLLSDTFKYALSETSFVSASVLENILAAYIDVGEYLSFINSSFPSLDKELFMDRIYGLGLHLENTGRNNVHFNPNHSVMVKFGEGLQRKVIENEGYLPAELNSILFLENETKSISIQHSLSKEVTDLFLKKVKSINHNWFSQELDAWQIEIEHHKENASNIDRFELRDHKRLFCKESDVIINFLRRKIDSTKDVRSFLSNKYRSVYDEFLMKSNLLYPEDLKVVIGLSENPILDKKTTLAITDQILLEDILSTRSIKPGDKSAEELLPLRDLLVGKKIFKENADIDFLIEDAENIGRRYLSGKENIFHKNFERSLQETKRALAHLNKKPKVGRTVTMNAPEMG